METPTSESSIKKGQKATFELVEQLRKKATDKQQALIIGVLLYSGMFLRELVELTAADIDVTNAAIRIRKQVAHDKKERILAIPAHLGAELADFLDPKKTYVFRTDLFPQINIRYVNRLFLRFSKQFNIELTPKKVQQLYRSKNLREGKKASFGLGRFDQKRRASEAQLALLLKHQKDDRSKLILEILLETGCLASEILALQRGHIDFLQNQIRLVGKRNRLLDISARLTSRLFSYCEDNALSCDDHVLSHAKKPMTYTRLSQILSAIGPIRITAKMIRYSAYSALFGQQLSNAELIRRSGLRNIAKFHLFGALHEHE